MCSGGARVKRAVGPGTTQVGPIIETKISINKYITKTHDYLLINTKKARKRKHSNTIVYIEPTSISRNVQKGGPKK